MSKRLKISSNMPWLKRPPFEYTVWLDRQCDQLEKEKTTKDFQIGKLEAEIQALKEELARSGNAQFIKQGEYAIQQNRELYKINGELTGEIARLQTENEYLKKRVEQFESATKQRTPTARLQNGRFTSDLPKEEKERIAFLMDEAGFEPEAIADDLEISLDSVRKYISEYKRKNKEDNTVVADWRNNDSAVCY